jgi:hypothetical protein
MCTVRDGRQYEASDGADLGELSKVLAVYEIFPQGWVVHSCAATALIVGCVF